MRKMYQYLVTTEIKTPFWKKALRFFWFMKKRYEFKIYLTHRLDANSIVRTSEERLKILKPINHE